MKGAEVKKDKKQSLQADEVSLDFTDPYQLIDTLEQRNIGLVLQALKALKSFVRPNYIRKLLDYNLLDKLNQFILEKSSSADVIEFSLSLLIELLNFKSVLEQMADNEEFILQLFLLFKTKPLDIQVSSLKCLSLLTQLEIPCQILFEKCDLNFLLLRLSINDPDIHACVLKIVYNLLQDIVIAEKIVNLPGFSYGPLLRLLSSDYPTVQHLSANLIIWLTSYNHLTELKEILVDEGGVHILMNIIENHRWPDLHEKVFKILINLSFIDITFDKIGEDGLKSMISYVDEIESQKLEFASYDSILKMSKNSWKGLSLFVVYGLTEVVTKHLTDEMTSSMFKLSVRGMAVICKNETALQTLEEDPNLLILMFDVLENKEKHFDWTIQHDAADSIFSMITRSQIFFEIFKAHQRWEVIIDLMVKSPNMPPYQTLLLLCTMLKSIVLDIYKLIKCPGIYSNKLIHVIKHLMADPKEERTELKCTATEIMEILVQFPEFREKLQENKVYRTLSKLLFRTNENLTILESYLKLFITLSVWDSTFIDELVYIHAIDWFINKSSLIQRLPLARRFLDLVFNKCLYIKIHFTNRLDLWDKIDTGFYVHRGNVHSGISNDQDSHFESLKTIIKEKDLKNRPIYYVDFGDMKHEQYMKKWMSVTSTSTTFDVGGLNWDSKSMDSRHQEDQDCYVDQWGILKDPYLKLQLRELKMLLGYHPENEVEFNLSTALNREEYLNKIKLLGKFVCKVMSSLEEEEEEECRNHSFELHLSEIKEDLNSAVIPLGYVKLGTKFERALLFKALGDQVGIPSALVRAHCGNGWNEIFLTPPQELDPEPEPELINEPRQMSSVKARSKSRMSVSTAMLGQTMSKRKSVARRTSVKLDKRMSRKSLKSLTKINEDKLVELDLPPMWHLKAYHAYMKTNHIVDLEKNPGQIIVMGSVEAEDYTTEACCIHPYFLKRSILPPLIKRTDASIPVQ